MSTSHEPSASCQGGVGEGGERSKLQTLATRMDRPHHRGFLKLKGFVANNTNSAFPGAAFTLHWGMNVCFPRLCSQHAKKGAGGESSSGPVLFPS